MFFFFFKQKTAYEMRISDWSSDVCSSDLQGRAVGVGGVGRGEDERRRRGGRILITHEGAQPVDRRGRAELRGAEMLDEVAAAHAACLLHAREIGRASCRERVCQYV